MKKIIPWGLVIIFLAGLLASCDSLKSLSVQGASSTPQTTVLDYSNSEAVNLLTSLVQGNYTGFTKDFSSSLILKFTQTEFISLQNKILPLGNYRSCTFARVSSESDLIVVIYLCDFQLGSVTLILNLEPAVPYLISDFSFPNL